MIGLKDIVDLLAGCAEYVKANVPPPGWWPSALTLAAILMVAGFVLALWGNRLPPDILSKVFGCFAILVGLKMLWPRKTTEA